MPLGYIMRDLSDEEFIDGREGSDDAGGAPQGQNPACDVPGNGPLEDRRGVSCKIRDTSVEFDPARIFQNRTNRRRAFTGCNLQGSITERAPFDVIAK